MKKRRPNDEPKAFARDYLDGLAGLIRRLDAAPFAALIGELQRAYDGDRQIFIAGNGGSAATASHMACDLAKTVLGDRPPASLRRFRVLALTDNVPMITAVGNDWSYDRVFVEQLELYARRGDLLIVITGSGNSPNVVRAVEWARRKGLRTAGLLGFDGGKVRRLLDTVVLIPDDRYGYIEDLHMIADHAVTAFFKQQFARRPRRRAGR